ncbi:MAG: diaminopimelate epimerase [Bacteroidetes bacterium]|nr:MAG: diaminopimelate epimerase [Bacteroidota bacterium]
MKIHFYKYQGTGNDFVILDNRQWSYTALTMDKVKFLCDRRFGIGADGLMLMNQKTGFDFEMKYYNADGRESSMCGNGGRCMVKFAYDMGIHKGKYCFQAVDGPHEAEIDDDGTVNLRMQDVHEINDYHSDFILDTGSPHYVKVVSDVMDYDVLHRGMDIRYSTDFAKEGINVNFVEQKRPDEIIVRTYERGVEDETLSCGTGVTASAIVCYHNEIGFNDVTVLTRGGKLVVRFDKTNENSFQNVWLCGPAEKVFEGEIELKP